MTIKKLAVLSILLLAIVSISSNVFAQQNQRSKKTPEEMATKMADRMKSNLSLSDDQYKQVYDLALTRSKNRISNKEMYKSMDKETRKQTKMKHREEFMTQLSGILNPDQMKKFQENRANHKQQRKNKSEKQ
jgi:hypothetical protein